MLHLGGSCTLLMILNLDHFHGQGVKMALADGLIERAREGQTGREVSI